MVRDNDLQSDRRSAERFPVSLPVETDKGPGITRDVSVSGLFLVIDNDIALGESLEITMSIPDPDDPQNRSSVLLMLRGRVVRVERAPGVGAGVGINLDEDSRYFALAS